MLLGSIAVRPIRLLRPNALGVNHLLDLYISKLTPSPEATVSTQITESSNGRNMTPFLTDTAHSH